MYSGDDAAMVADVSQHGRTRSARARQQPSEAKWMNDWGGEGDKLKSGVFCFEGDEEYCGLIHDKGRGLTEKLAALTDPCQLDPLGEF